VGTAIPPEPAPFDHILDRITGSDPSVTDYILEAPGRSARIADAISWKKHLLSLYSFGLAMPDFN
jgi:hypothetical protein